MASNQELVRLIDERGVTVTVSAEKADARIAGGYKRAGGRKAAASAPADDGPFNPGDHNVADVVTYLTDADEAERSRVLEAETAGKQRAGVVGWTAPSNTEV